MSADIDGREALREIRLHFYRHMIMCRSAEFVTGFYSDKSSAETYKAAGDRHLKRIQALNGLFPEGDEVEHDYARFMESKSC